MSFCDDCWPRQPAHKANTAKLFDRPHVKEDKATILLIKSIMEPPVDEEEVRKLHKQDQDSRWFGVVKSTPHAKSQFHDFGRFDELMADSRPLLGSDRYPKLVSFIGDTYAGKSTIVKALLSLGNRDNTDVSLEGMSAPVPGSRANEGTATSEGVHLYADPEYLESSMPILYADCEGLNAGEKIPFAAAEPPQASRRNSIGGNKFRRRLEGRVRPIEWTKPNDPKMGTRQFAVENLYPRFLYTFSDVLVFVQKNPNQLHITYKYLVDWARHSVEKSVNQAILPVAVVVINAAEMDEDARRWTIEGATEDFFRDVKGITTDDSLKELMKNFLAENDERTLSAQELLECYYKSVRVIRVPAKKADTYNLINTQLVLLRGEILRACQRALDEKRIKRRLASVDDLQQYLHAGFDHFASDLDRPFDFRAVDTRNKLIAHDFSDHILTLASTIYETTQGQNTRGQRLSLSPANLFNGLCAFIASCILLDYVRNDLQGSVLDYYPKEYSPFCKTALQMFCNDFLPCEFRSKKIQVCCNVKSAHDKGHQNEKGKRVLGNYRSSLDPSRFEAGWIEKIEQELKAQEQKFSSARRKTFPLHQTPSISAGEATSSVDVKIMSKLHSDVLADFFAHVASSKDFVSCVSCFRCLMATPEHALECGHVLCDSCIRDLGDEKDDLAIIVRSCPLHTELRDMDWAIAQKPDFAGLRILGGVRGIVELEILRAIENRINLNIPSGGIPIQRLFDLVVGTSTGGIVALGLVAMQWPVSTCITIFEALCQDAFQEREGAGTIFEKVVTIKHNSKWKTTPLHDVLRKAFGEGLLFGGRSNVANHAGKVAVVSTSRTGNRSLILSNYNRQQMSDPGYTLETSRSMDEAFKIWEAAAATSAAPSYFKPFERQVGRNVTKTYLDGALNHNNPVVVAKRERRLLWPDVASRHPDVFLSLGTGQNARALETRLKVLEGRSREAHLKAKAQASNHGRKRFRSLRGIKDFFSVLSDKMENILDTEWAWQEFYRDTVGEHWASDFGSRYIRLNPDLGRDPPALDAKHKVDSLQGDVVKLLQQWPLSGDIEEVANMLVASCFYFKKEKSQICKRDGTQTFLCAGHIRCKLAHEDQYVKRLAEFLKNQIVGNFLPSFVIKNRLSSNDENKIDLTRDSLEYMATHKVFELRSVLQIETSDREEQVYILLRLRRQGNSRRIQTRDYPLSGFPRKFMVEDERNGELVPLNSTRPILLGRVARDYALTMVAASRQQQQRQEMLKRRHQSGDSNSPKFAELAATMSKVSIASRVATRNGSTESLAESDTEERQGMLAEHVFEEYKAWSKE
ncbi:Calcium-independent phospholipase A2-gamma [Cyphellophora attinorum]|uniref:Calcium-independent phospholipase A2-gamma n=1 Tax=Cyphellophora attinorum TaxID=1664694 RepID=A0A0N1NXW0_9EURO|nr:Calcium-independent phospholipase A2-gamma [Phialophora attinorum]KPI35954.1 Calcium-independent phospholipase A2-gamma [Phialophora attinorum]